MTSNADLRARFQAAFMPNYGVPPVALVRGEGARVWDADGTEYLDLIAGIAVSSLGHAHPALARAVAAQAATLAHTSNLFVNEPAVRLAERLVELAGGGARVFLSNSGTEANEAALKIAIKYGKTHGRRFFVATENGFHGRTLGALSLTGKTSIREPFGPYALDVRFVPYGDADALRAYVNDDCAAVFLEPTQGEAGVVPPPHGYLAEARDICDLTGTLLVADEIQSAIGRTGAWFAFQHEDVRPDLLTLAKGLGGGLPVGACLAFGDHGAILAKGDHGSTFGGNPVAAAAALAVLDTIEAEGLLAHATAVGDVLAEGLNDVDHPLLAGVRGRGLWRGLVLADAVAPAVEAAARDAGFLVNAVQPGAIRLAPPLILSPEQARSFTAALPSVLDAAQKAS
ncbi:acetylornithine transaminase [Actinomadura flavalba]|uniref:acetylornithine transaminase n=1 Tax=Actinomadura flavalba TaxID=1120938 RepID=UPI0003790304|nr:acetylornithine transaminase [Actinomadura flavalba]